MSPMTQWEQLAQAGEGPCSGVKDGGCGIDSSVCPISSTFLVSYMPCVINKCCLGKSKLYLHPTSLYVKLCHSSMISN
jgi:hypothetical protein